MLNLQRERKKRGFSQAKLASKLGITQGAISQWETGIAKPRTSLLYKIADVLGCTVDDLLRPTEGTK